MNHVQYVFPCEASNFETHPRIYWIVTLPSSSGEWRFLGIFKNMQNPGDDYYWEGGWGGRPNEFLIQRRKNTYHLESRWLNSHVLVYHIPLLSHLFGGCAIYFPDGIIMFCYTTSSFMANSLHDPWLIQPFRVPAKESKGIAAKGSTTLCKIFKYPIGRNFRDVGVHVFFRKE